MTIPAPFNWCPDCNEACHDHPTICTVCGATLTSPPPPSTTTSSTTPMEHIRVRLIPETITNDIRRQSSNEVRNLLSSLSTRIETIRNEQNNLQQQVHDYMALQDAFDIDDGTDNVVDIQPFLNDLFNNLNNDIESNKSAGTSKNILDTLPRIKYTTDCALFQQCVVELDVDENNDTTDTTNQLTEMQSSSTSETTTTMKNTHSSKLTISAIPGEFCKWPTMYDAHEETTIQTNRCRMSNMTLVVADPPGTGENGILSENTIQTIQTIIHKHRSRVILYMNRGGTDVTFVQKAKLAQQYGASVCMIGNHLPNGPWPYSMRDSTNEAMKLQLTTPTIMISYEHGQLLQQLYFKQQHNVTSNSNNSQYITGTIVVQSKNEMECCCICTESYSIDCTILQIKPGCEHYFHESCALQWLQSHNTCPYCRYALPFEDTEREQNRLRQQQQQQDTNSSNMSNDYYG
jgi:hypothetical protein